MFQPTVLQRPATACMRTIELQAANTFITVEILFAEHCLEAIVLILEDNCGLVARFDNGDTPILFAQRAAIPSQSHQRPDLSSVYLECCCHTPLLKQHDSIASIGFNIM